MVRTVRIESYVLSKTTGEEKLLYGAITDTYNIEGYKIQQDHHTTDGFLFRQIFFSYDSQNRSIEEIDYLGNGSLRQKTSYTYDNYKKTAEAAFYQPDGCLSYRVVFRFDVDYDLNELIGFQATESFFYRARVWVEAAQYDSSGSLIQKYTAVNKEDMREITHTREDSRGNLRTSEVKTIYIYNTNGKITGRHYSVNGTVLNRGESGDNVEQQSDVDSNGNWTKRAFSVGSDTQVEYRTITYY